jgi:hypothetical protein
MTPRRILNHVVAIILVSVSLSRSASSLQISTSNYKRKIRPTTHFYTPQSYNTQRISRLTQIHASHTITNLQRVNIRLEGLGPYAVVSTLMLNGGLRLFSMYREEPDPVNQRINLLFLALLVASILSSFLTAVVFTMISIHSKAAIGMGKDYAFEKYFAQTAADRTVGFRSLQVALVSFLGAFVLKAKLLLFKKKKEQQVGDGKSTLLMESAGGIALSLIVGFILFRMLRIGNFAKELIFN